MNWLKPTADSVTVREPNTCPHDDWKVFGHNKIGRGTCTKCQIEMDLDDLLNNWKSRIEREMWAAVGK